MQHPPQTRLIHPSIGQGKPTEGRPDEGARVEEGTISSSRNTFLGARQGYGAAGDDSRHSREPLMVGHSQSGSEVPEEVQGTRSWSGSVKGDYRCDAEGRCGRQGVPTSAKSIGEAPARIVETPAKSVSVESIPNEFVELTLAALAEETSKPPAHPVVAASDGPLVNTSHDPAHATRIELAAAQENKKERLSNSARVPQLTRVSEQQPTGTPQPAVPGPASVVGGALRNERTLTALPDGCAVTPQTTPQSSPKSLVDSIPASPKPPVGHLTIVLSAESIDEPVARCLPIEPIIMESVTEPVAETAKPDIESVSDIVWRPVTEPAIEVYVTPSAVQPRAADVVQPTVGSMPKVPGIEISRTPSLSIVPAVAAPHIQLGEGVGPVPQGKTSKPEPLPVVPPGGGVGIETALQAPLAFSKPSRFAAGFLRNRSLSKLFRSLKYRVLPRKGREGKTISLLPVPPSPVRPSLEDATPTKTKAPIPLSPVDDLGPLGDGGEPRIPTAENCMEDSRGDCKSSPMPLSNPSIPPTTHSKQTTQSLQSRHPATQLAHRRAIALRALELQQIREDEREVARLRGGGCCGGDGGGKSIDPTPHQTGTGLPLPTEKPPVAPPPLVTPRTPKPGEPPQGDPSRSRTQSQTAPQRSRAQSHASQRTNKPGAEARSRRGSQATLKEAASVSRQPSQREIRSRTTSQVEPRSRKQSRVGEPGTSSQTRGARSRTTSKAPGVPPLPSMS